MTVVPYRSNLFQTYKEIHRFLITCQEQASQDNQTKIASLSLEIDPIDPLVLLDKIATSERIHFYYENPIKRESTIAFDSVIFHESKSDERFYSAQNFIDFWVSHTLSTGIHGLSFPGPYFLCRFTFFEQSLIENSPFPASSLFLPRFQIIKRRENYSIVINLAVHAYSNAATMADEIWGLIKEIRGFSHQIFRFTRRPDQFNGQYSYPNSPQSILNLGNFKSAVASALRVIQAQKLHKVVLAHAVDVTASAPFKLSASLNNLRTLHPDCYVFSTSNGSGQTFLGASPERLISVSHQQLVTDALAGSAPRGGTPLEDAALANRLLCNQKERHEHRVVVDFITQQLIHLGLQPKFFPTPGLLQLSNIQHLHTPIRAHLTTQTNPLSILSVLHPTPAVAGAPRELAYQQIRRYEPFERSLYAGSLGWIDHQGNSEFFVGIRSALIEENHARLYAGAGIVAGSNPDKELAEVKLKLKALLEALV
ncbi:MAG: isochorismate synthase [Pseudanabaenales cyanobacterium]|nr:isochorismate synthase [Pseudanabaenales cyanobacterium]